MTDNASSTNLGMPQLPAPAYPADVRARLEADAKEIIARYPGSRSALLPLLHLVQSEEGHVTRTGMRFCADVLGLTTAEVTAVATFYTMYRRKPSGDYQVGVCTNTLCAVMGGDAIFEELKEHLGVGNDETTADGKVTLEHIECNAAFGAKSTVSSSIDSVIISAAAEAAVVAVSCAPATPACSRTVSPRPVSCR